MLPRHLPCIVNAHAAWLTCGMWHEAGCPPCTPPPPCCPTTRWRFKPPAAGSMWRGNAPPDGGIALDIDAEGGVQLGDGLLDVRRASRRRQRAASWSSLLWAGAAGCCCCGGSHRALRRACILTFIALSVLAGVATGALVTWTGPGVATLQQLKVGRLCMHASHFDPPPASPQQAGKEASQTAEEIRQVIPLVREVLQQVAGISGGLCWLTTWCNGTTPQALWAGAAGAAGNATAAALPPPPQLG